MIIVLIKKQIRVRQNNSWHSNVIEDKHKKWYKKLNKKWKTYFSQKYLKSLSTIDKFTLHGFARHYIKRRNFRGEKVLQFRGILDRFSKVWPAKYIFVKIRESFFPTQNELHRITWWVIDEALPLKVIIRKN